MTPAQRLALLTGLTITALLAVAFAPLGPLHRAAIWGLVLLTSFAGWGSVIERWIARTGAADLGLRIAWGMAIAIAFGGIACVATIATRPVLLAMILIGVALQLFRVAREGHGERPAPPSIATLVALVCTGLLAGVQYYSGAAGANWTHDDLVAYLAFPEKILATGTLLEPFSLRRMAAYGGQSLLHALTLIGCDSALQAPLLDLGIALLAVLALLIGDRWRARPGLWLLPILLMITLPSVRANTTSIMSGVVIFLALYRTARAADFAVAPRRLAALLGMLAAAAASLRQPFIVPAAAFLALFYAPTLIGALRQTSGEWRAQLAEVAVAPLAMLICLLPWMILAINSNGTPLYPLMYGYYRPDAGDLSAATFAEHIAFLWANLEHCYPVRSLPLLLVAALLFPWRQTRGALPALVGAAFLGFVAAVWAFPVSDPWNLSRYYFGFVVAAALAVAQHGCSLRRDDWRADRVRGALPALLVLAAIAFQVPAVAVDSYKNYGALVTRIAAVVQRPAVLTESSERYRALQAAVPAHTPLFVMLDESFWLDFKRNRIELIDLPGQVSPPPGIPLDDDEAFVSYLKARGVRYVAFVRPSASQYLYRRKMWVQLLEPSAAPLWRNAAPFYLKTFDRFESLLQSRKRLYDDGKMAVLDLETPAA